MKKFVPLMLAVLMLTGCGKKEIKESSDTHELQVEVSEQELVSVPATVTEKETEKETEAPAETKKKHDKIKVDKNTDLDLSKIMIGDHEYDFGTLTVGELMEATDTQELGFATLSVQKNEFNCSAYGFGKFSETETLPDGLEYPDYGSYGTVYYLEYKIGDEWLPELNSENINDAEIVTFASDECGEDFNITFAGKLAWQEELPLEDAKKALGEGTAVGDHDFIAYCDGETTLVLGLDMFEDTVKNIYVYRNEG